MASDRPRLDELEKLARELEFEGGATVVAPAPNVAGPNDPTGHEIDLNDLTTTRSVEPATTVRPRATLPALEFDSDQTRVDDAPHVRVSDLPVAFSEPPTIPEDKSVVARIVHSVVARLPRGVQKAVSKVTGEQPIYDGKLPGVAVKPPAPPPRKDGGVDPAAWRELRTVPLLDGLPNEALRDALLAGEARVMVLERDALIPHDHQISLVRTGQVALASFNAQALAEERRLQSTAMAASKDGKVDKKERKRREKLGPLIRVAEKNFAFFEDGDVVETSVGARDHQNLASYMVTPGTVITFDRGRVDLWKRIYPFMADRFRRAAQVARAKLDATDGAKAMVADFFIRHGLSVSMTLRVRKLDACIECGACEQACEDRYGVNRLSLNGRILGTLDFVDTCHTCTDQRCIDPCNFDSISFDPVRREILINEASCTGCTLCATACPYNAIEMHDLADAPALELRLKNANALEFGDGKPRKAKLKRMASKCDHCTFYEDQACITACPTGALLEIAPSDAFTQLPDQARQSAKAGFDRTAAIDIDSLNAIETFTGKNKSFSQGLGRSKAPEKKLKVPMWWAIGMAAVFAALGEIVLRLKFPQLSVSYLLMTIVDGIPHEIAIEKVDYRPGSELAVNLGYIGTALMISGLLYVARRRFSFMRNVGTLRAWFDWHVLAGVVGPSFVAMHTAAKLDNWVSLAFWSMIATVASGLLGRYLTTQLPDRASRSMVEIADIQGSLARLRDKHPGVRNADAWFEHYQRRLETFLASLGGAEKPATFGGAVKTFFWTMRDDLAGWRRMRELNKALKVTVHGKGSGKVRRQARRHARELIQAERRRVLLPKLMPLFNKWKAIHVPMAVVLTVLATIHIVLALKS